LGCFKGIFTNNKTFQELDPFWVVFESLVKSDYLVPGIFNQDQNYSTFIPKPKIDQK
jgi:hypothetical protein